MFSDIFMITGSGLIDPILAIFIKENLTGGTIFAAGFASMLFLATKSCVQLPFSRYVDKSDNKLRWLLIGSFISVVVPLMYIFIDSVTLMYALQIIAGVGSGLAYPTWLSLWSLNLDRNHESYEWSLYSTSVGIGTALTGALGGFLATYAGFKVTFLVVSFLALIGCLLLFALANHRSFISRWSFGLLKKSRK